MDKLVLIGLQKEFKRKKVIDNINLTLSNGVYGLLGENAAGKTTLMRLICGLLKESEGEITYNGVNIHYNFSFIHQQYFICYVLNICDYVCR